MNLQIRVAALTVLSSVWMASGCLVVDDPQHCANRDGDRTCAELYATGVQCSVCERFYNGCVDDEPEPECRIEDSEASESSSDDGASSSDGAVDCEECPSDDVGPEGSVR